jgi:hypothetical protein
MLIVVVLIVVMLSVIMLNVVMLNVVLLSVVVPSKRCLELYSKHFIFFVSHEWTDKIECLLGQELYSTS